MSRNNLSEVGDFSSGHIKDLRRQRFGKLTVKAFDHSDKKHSYWLCECDCGNTVVKTNYQLQINQYPSCGCAPRYRSRPKRNNVLTHHMTGTTLYRIWKSMRSRCLCKNQSRREYRDYSGRGIVVCDEWNSFENFYEWAMANGYEEGLSIDRIDNNGNYEPSNCRWIPKNQQVRNRRKTVWLTYNGEKRALTEWCELFGLNKKTVYNRLHNYGWTEPSEILFGKGVKTCQQIY